MNDDKKKLERKITLTYSLLKKCDDNAISRGGVCLSRLVRAMQRIAKERKGKIKRTFLCIRKLRDNARSEGRGYLRALIRAWEREGCSTDRHRRSGGKFSISQDQESEKLRKNLKK